MGKNSVYIGVSLDGYIADKNGGLSFLETFKIPEGEDMGYYNFINQIDALVMGRVTFETVCNFDVEWPYQKPVFVLSSTISEIPKQYKDKAFLVNGKLSEIVKYINQKGYQHLYIDGGTTIQHFLKENLIDEMIITTIPVLIGGGTSLFGDLEKPLKFKCIKTEIFADTIVQNHFQLLR